MNCDEVRPKLAALLDGELTPAEAQTVWAHLAGCARCAGARDEIAALGGLADVWRVGEDYGAVWEAVRRQIDPRTDAELLRAMLNELGQMRAELQAARAELKAARAEVRELRRHIGTGVAEPERKPSVMLRPFVSADVLRRIV